MYSIRDDTLYTFAPLRLHEYNCFGDLQVMFFYLIGVKCADEALFRIMLFECID